MPRQIERTEELLEKANSLPLSPGVYMMRDKNGKVIYVGKSRKLKNRVSQYFQNSRKNTTTSQMVFHAEDFEYILCKTEIEALTLENALIKQYQSLLEMDGVALEISDEALLLIAQKAIDRQIGARGLRAIMEKIMTSIMFLIPSDLSIKKVVITPEAVDGGDPVIMRDSAHPRQALSGKR